ncbi:hypothetical protein [Rhizobium sp. 18055]|jgi:hypothetical protein|uniref:hypothetical protein n=1 Tax=Rhizobium sp. 18055 TaxID=2681403 RepID=UPI001359EF7F|nr:hypothetical protein [Rhizobium sp. 18055]
MTWGKSYSPRMSALAVAEANFPDQASKVQHLFRVSEAFRSMCEDLAAVVETLARIDDLPHNERTVRRQEYEGLADALVNEIGEALAQSNVVVLRRPEEAKPRSR